MIKKFLRRPLTILFNRWIQGGIAFFVVCVAGSLLYSWHVQHTTDREMARHARFLETQKQNATNRSKSVGIENATDTAAVVESLTEPNASREMPTETPEESIDWASMDAAAGFLPDAMAIAETPVEEVPVSPYGFGPYPSVPADFPETITIPWQWSDDLVHKFRDAQPSFELMARVLIQLWNQGDHGFEGGLIDIDTGTVYPQYRDAVYVRRTESFFEKAIGWFTEETTFEFYSGPDIPDQTIEMIHNGENPPGIRILDLDTDGINAYTFLNIR